MGTKDTQQQEDKELEIIIEGEGESKTKEKAEENSAEETAQHEDEGDEASLRAADDAAAETAETESEREAIRARRRQERHEKKEKQREREDNLRRELSSRDALIDEMRQRLDAVERKSHGVDVAQLDAAITETKNAYTYFKGQIEVAAKTQNGAAMADAMEKMVIARQKAEQLTTVKERLSQGQATPPPLDPRLKDQAERWLSDNKWYDVRGTDIDSRIVADEDTRLANEGRLNPSTKEYWDELTSRLKKRLPHKFASVYNSRQETQQSRAPVAGSGKEGGSGSSGKETVRISPERVQAMKDAGIWDDPKARSEMIKSYQTFDAEQRQTN